MVRCFKPVTPPKKQRKKRAAAEPADSGVDGGNDSDDSVQKPAKPKRRRKTKKPKVVIKDRPHTRYYSGDYLAIRTEEDSYWVARAWQHVWSNKPVVKIGWLEEVPDDNEDEALRDGDRVYTYGHEDLLDTDTIITGIELRRRAGHNGRWVMSVREQERIEGELQKSVRGEVSDASEAGSGSEDSEPSPPKKRKGGRVKKADSPDKSKAKKKKSPEKDVKADKEGKSPKRKRPVWTAEERKNPNLRLRPNLKVKEWDKDPLIYSTEKVPYVSSTAHSRLVFRAVALGDHKMLQQLVDDRKKVAVVCMRRSLVDSEDPLNMAIEKEDLKACQILCKEMFDLKNSKIPESKRERVAPPTNLAVTKGTGKYNYRSLGVPYTRSLTVSRGSKEGTNALNKDADPHNRIKDYDEDKYIKAALTYGTNKAFLDKLHVALKDEHKDTAQRFLFFAVRYGHRHLAYELMKDADTTGMGNKWNFLHKDVLRFDGQDLKKFRDISVKKKPWDNCQITPLHCACINPNPKYLAALLNVLPDYNRADLRSFKLIHYAAACEGPGPLELLLRKGVDPEQPTTGGITPLMHAAICDRVHNVRALISHAKKVAENEANDSKKRKDDDDDDSGDGEDEEEEDKQDIANKWGVGGINRPCDKPPHASHTALTLAIERSIHGDTELIEYLLDNGAEVEKRMNAGHDKKSPLMVAAECGHLDMVKLLHARGAIIDAKDSKKRTALVYAVMNGHAHIASYFLRLGSDPDVADTSGNTAVHYAAAYGWYFCLKALLDAGADPNVASDWKVTPLGIAFLKGHMGLADILLKQPGVDINFKDDKGMTLLAQACSSPMEEGLISQVRYLVEEKHADVTIPDVGGNTPLHHVANTEIKKTLWRGYRHVTDTDPEIVKVSARLADILIRAGADPSATNSRSHTPAMLALQKGNSAVVLVVTDAGGTVSAEPDEQGSTVLHLLAARCMEEGTAGLLDILAKCAGKVMQRCVTVFDHKGWSPLLLACRNYSQWDGKTSAASKDDSDSEEEDEEEEEEDDESTLSQTYDDPTEEERREWQQDHNQRMQEREERRRKREQKKKDRESSEATDNDKALEQGRKVLQILLQNCKASPSDIVQEKHFGPSESVPKELKDRFDEDGRFSCAHHLSMCQKERAVNGDHCPALSLLLKHRPVLNRVDLEGRNPLMYSIEQGKHHAAVAMINAKCCNIEQQVPSTHGANKGATALILAARGGLSSVVESLCDSGADVTVTDDDGNTALHYAAMALQDHDQPSMLKILQRLLKVNSRLVNKQNKKGRTPLHLAVNANSGDTDSSSEPEEVLLAAGADLFIKDTRGRLPLHYVFVKIGGHRDSGDLDPIEQLTTLTGAMRDRGLDTEDGYGQRPLHRAALRGAGVCCMHLLQHGCDLDLPDRRGNTPLGLSVFGGHESCTILLLQKNANFNINVVKPPWDPEEEARDKKKQEDERLARAGKTVKPVFKEWFWEPMKPPEKSVRTEVPLFRLAVSHEWQGVLFMLMDMLEEQGVSYAQAVESALNEDKYQLALTLIRKNRDKKRMLTLNAQGQSLLHVLCTRRRGAERTRLAELLTQAGLNLQAADTHGCTPLHYACLSHNTPLVTFLLEHGVKVNVKDKRGHVPMSMAFWRLQYSGQDSIAIAKMLLQKKANLEALCCYPKEDSPLFGYKVIATEKPYNAVYDAPSVTPLILALSLCDFDTAKALLAMGASVNTADSDGRGPLTHAVITNDMDIVKLVLNPSYKKSQPTQKDSDDVTSSRSKGKTPRKRGRTRRKTPMKKKSSRRAFNLAQNLDEDKDSSDDESDKEADSDEANEDDEEDVLSSDDEDVAADVTKNTKVNVNAADEDGNTALHHLVAPLRYGTYDNVKMFNVLLKAGADISKRNKKGLTPYDVTQQKGHYAPKLAQAMASKLGKLKKSAGDLVAVTVNDGLSGKRETPKYRQDALKLLEDFDKAQQKEPDLAPEVDPLLEMGQTGEIVQDTDTLEYLDILMTKIDVKRGNYGLYNFYKMQVVYQKGIEVYVLFNRWGRIGDEGQFQQTPFSHREDCVKEFKKIFKSKSGNDWDHVNEFEAKEGKYRLVQREVRRHKKNLHDLKLKLDSALPSKLPSELQYFVKQLTDVTCLQRATKETGIDTTAIPFGRLKEEALIKARDILNKLMPVINNKEKLVRDGGIYKKPEEFYVFADKIAKLSTEYYYLIPQSGFEYERVEPIDNINKWKQELKKLDNLCELELAGAVLAGAQSKVKVMNHLDYVYYCMNCQLRLLDRDTDESQYLLRMVHARSAAHKVENIFAVARPGEQERLARCGIPGNHRLLFHGSSTSNLISILSRGLLVAPPEAGRTGSLFGQGIYTADVFDKSLPYCYNWSEEGETSKYMLICEVALGRSQDMYNLPDDSFKKLPKNVRSVRGVGQHQPDGRYCVTLPTGAEAALGQVVSVGDSPPPVRGGRAAHHGYWLLNYNEYIVYDDSQLCIRYIVQFKA